MPSDSQARNAPQNKPTSVLLSLFAGLLGFGSVATLGVQLTPWPDNFSVSVKFEHLEEAGDQYDCIFVGSSNIFRSVVPLVIDDELAKHGVELRSFNLGGPGMYAHEADYVLRRLLALEMVVPRYVFVEPEDWNPRPTTDEEPLDLLTDRGVFWHDARQTTAALLGILELDEPRAQKLELAGAHLQAFVWKLTSYGQGSRILSVLRGVDAVQPMTREDVALTAGYQAIAKLPINQTINRRKSLTKAPEEYRTRIQSMRTENRTPLAADAFSRRTIHAQQAFIESTGAVPIYVLPALGEARPHALRLAEEEAIRLMAYNDPARYPEFYEIENRFDPNHPTHAGAVMFSERFARDLAKLLSR